MHLPNRAPTYPLVKRIAPEDGELAFVWGDSHYGACDEPAMDLAVSCADRAGASILIGNGDIFNCATVSPHKETREHAIREYGDLDGERGMGAKYLRWMASSGRRAILGVGNHEDWINDVALFSGLGPTLSVRTALGIPDNVEVLPHGYQLRVGSLAIEHGDILFPRGSGPRNLARTILMRYPAQTTLVGHFHREDYAVTTTPDSRGILRSHAAYAIGHLSDPRAHFRYAGRVPDWQQGFAMIRFWKEGDQQRFTVKQVQVHRTRRGLPIFEYDGHVYR